MSRTQLGLRLSHDEAEQLRRVARSRRMSLGELVTTLLRDERAQQGQGIWLDLDPIAHTALRAVAAAAETTPEEVMQRFARRWLAADLARLQRELGADSLPGTTTTGSPDGSLAASSVGNPDSDAFDEPDDVLFTVSED